MCLGSESVTSAIVDRQKVTLEVDTTPPVITLLGDGRPAIAPDGSLAMIDTVIAGSDWRDLGVRAEDTVDGDVSGPRRKMYLARMLSATKMHNGILLLNVLCELFSYVTEKVMSYGAGAVDTTYPTEEDKDFSFRIEYRVHDAMGNMATTAFRLIKVVCPPNESYCLLGM